LKPLRVFYYCHAFTRAQPFALIFFPVGEKGRAARLSFDIFFELNGALIYEQGTAIFDFRTVYSKQIKILQSLIDVRGWFWDF